MDSAVVLDIVKERLGIRTTVRDSYLLAIVDSVIKELQDEKGLVLDGANPYHLMFTVDYVTWRYQSVNDEYKYGSSIPRHLQFRLHNLMVHVGSANLRVDSVETVAVLPVIPIAYTVYILSTDGTKQMYLDGIWKAVDFVNGFWMVIA